MLLIELLLVRGRREQWLVWDLQVVLEIIVRATMSSVNEVLIRKNIFKMIVLQSSKCLCIAYPHVQSSQMHCSLTGTLGRTSGVFRGSSSRGCVFFGPFSCGPSGCRLGASGLSFGFGAILQSEGLQIIIILLPTVLLYRLINTIMKMEYTYLLCVGFGPESSRGEVFWGFLPAGVDVAFGFDGLSSRRYGIGRTCSGERRDGELSEGRRGLSEGRRGPSDGRRGLSLLLVTTSCVTILVLDVDVSFSSTVR